MFSCNVVALFIIEIIVPATICLLSAVGHDIVTFDRIADARIREIEPILAVMMYPVTGNVVVARPIQSKALVVVRGVVVRNVAMCHVVKVNACFIQTSCISHGESADVHLQKGC